MGHSKTALALLPLAFLLGGCEEKAASEPDVLPEHLVEHIEDAAIESGEITTHFDGVLVDDQVRVISERLVDGDLHARNLYLYFEGEPVLYRSRGGWNSDGVHHEVSALAEFAINGDPLGLVKRLDGSDLPIPPHEVEGIRERGRALHAAAIDTQHPETCDFNKSLRAGQVLATVIVPVGADCESGILRLYVRTEGGSAVHEFDRKGPVHAAWFRDFDGDDQFELLVSLGNHGSERLRGWRINDGRFAEISFGELTPAQRASFGGENEYRVEAGTLLRRYRTTNEARGRARLMYNWENHRWIPQAVKPRDALQAEVAGHWMGAFRLDIPEHGDFVVHQDCGRLEQAAIALPGELFLVAAPRSAPDACDGRDLLLRPGAWLAESNGPTLRLTGLTVRQRLEFSAAEEPGSSAAGTSADSSGE